MPCTRELSAHTNCVKHFLRESAETGRIYESQTTDKQEVECRDTRQEYGRCMEASLLPQSIEKMKSPPPCEMELNIHVACVANYIESASKYRKPYLYEKERKKGDDKCFPTRMAYARCMANKHVNNDVDDTHRMMKDTARAMQTQRLL